MTVKFDRTCPAWEENSKYNQMFILSNQRHFSDVLNVRGYVTLMEVLNVLTIPFDVVSHLDDRLYDLVWLRDRLDTIVFGVQEQDDGSMLITINIG